MAGASPSSLPPKDCLVKAAAAQNKAGKLPAATCPGGNCLWQFPLHTTAAAILLGQNRAVCHQRFLRSKKRRGYPRRPRPPGYKAADTVRGYGKILRLARKTGLQAKSLLKSKKWL
jgi:hypothetical protein